MNLERKAKINPVLWSTLLDYAEINPEILTNKFYGISGKKRYDEKWEEVVEILNNMGYLHKPVDKWKKSVADWRSKVKAKAASIRRGLSGTGEIRPSFYLNENEVRLLAILGTTTTERITEVKQEILPTQSSLDETDEAFVSSQGGGLTPLEELDHTFIPPPPIIPLLSNCCRQNGTEIKQRINPTQSFGENESASLSPPTRRPSIYSHNRLRKRISEVRSNKNAKMKRQNRRNNIRILQNFHDESLEAMEEMSKNIKELSDSVKLLMETNLKLVQLLEKS